MENSNWVISMFGRVKVRYGDDEETEVPGNPGRVLAYMASKLAGRPGSRVPDGTVTREEIIKKLWPGASYEAGQGNLRSALSSLKNAINKPNEAAREVVSRPNNKVLGLVGNIQTDLAVFQDRVDDALQKRDHYERIKMLTEALLLYQQEFLAKEDHDDDWIGAIRLLLARRYSDALDRITESIDALGEQNHATTKLLASEALRATGVTAYSMVTRVATPFTYLKNSTEFQEFFYRFMRLAGAAQQPFRAAQTYLQMEDGIRRNNLRWQGDKARVFDYITSYYTQSSEDVLVRLKQPSRPAVPYASSATTFVGRDTLIDKLRSATSEAKRLICLHGPPGVGKSRLAWETSRLMKGKFGERIWFVGLGGVTQMEQLPQRILEELKAEPIPRASVLDQAVAALSELVREEASLLILDNADRLVSPGEAAEHAIREMLRRVPSLVCFVTSRQSLDGADELVAVAPLPVPSYRDGLARVRAGTSVRIFEEVAKRHRIDFEVDGSNKRDVARLCSALDGLPLALELAAAWSRVLTPAEMIDRLRLVRSARPSTRRRSDTPHETVYDAIEVSYGLLAESKETSGGGLQSFFTRLSVFHGGWSLGAAAQICTDGKERDTLRLLADLSQRSLVQVAEFGGATRFYLLDSIRDFADSNLIDAERERLAAEHAAFFAKTSEEARRSLRGMRQKEWVDHLRVEHDNLLATLQWYQNGHGASDGTRDHLRLAETLAPYWTMCGYLEEGCKRLREALGRTGAADYPFEQMRAYLALGSLSRSRDLLDEAEDSYRRSLELAIQIDDVNGKAESLGGSGNVLWNRKKPNEGAEFYERAIALPADRTHPMVRAASLENLGMYLSQKGASTDNKTFQRGLRLFDAAQEIYVEHKASRSICRVIHNRATALGECGMKEDALILHQENLVRRGELEDQLGIVFSLEGVVMNGHGQRPVEKIAVLIGALENLRDEIQLPIPNEMQRVYSLMRKKVINAMGDAAFATALAIGAEMSIPETINFASNEL